jgi:AAA15 family ATPase/GTPase
MLIEFKFSNFLSYKDETVISMVPVESFKELKKSNTSSTKRKELNLLKSISIFGSNGGGKSNFINALGFVDGMVHNSFANSLKKEEEKESRDYFFKLNTSTENKPSTFEITFIVDEIIYRYGFEISKNTIVSEWLYKKVEKETMLFERIGSDFNINKSGFKEGLKRKEEVNSNVLFLSLLAQYNGIVSSQIFNWFKCFNIVSGLHNYHHNNITKVLLKHDHNFPTWLSRALRFLEVTDIKVNNEDENELLVFHSKYDENNLYHESIPMLLEKEESQGTRKLIYLLGAIYDTIIQGKLLCIDEFDNKLHPNLTIKLLSFFHEHNYRGAQLIFTAHDSILLDKKVFRRDQIWFVDRNQFGASELYPMSDFDSSVVRSTSDFRKKYLESTFGAAETLNITEQLIDLMYSDGN